MAQRFLGPWWRIVVMAATVIAYTRIAAADDFIATKASAISFTGPAYNWNGFYAGGHQRHFERPHSVSQSRWPRDRHRRRTAAASGARADHRDLLQLRDFRLDESQLRLSVRRQPRLQHRPWASERICRAFSLAILERCSLHLRRTATDCFRMSATSEKGQTRRLGCLGMSAASPTSRRIVARRRTGASGHQQTMLFAIIPAARSPGAPHRERRQEPVRNSPQKIVCCNEK